MSYFLTSSNDLEYFETHPPILAINNFINSNSNFISEFHSAQNLMVIIGFDYLGRKWAVELSSEVGYKLYL
jgi:hypothetical protein